MLKITDQKVKVSVQNYEDLAWKQESILKACIVGLRLIQEGAKEKELSAFDVSNLLEIALDLIPTEECIRLDRNLKPLD